MCFAIFPEAMETQIVRVQLDGTFAISVHSQCSNLNIRVIIRDSKMSALFRVFNTQVNLGIQG